MKPERQKAVDWIEKQNTKYARNLQEKAKFLAYSTPPQETPHPGVWIEVLKIARGMK